MLPAPLLPGMLDFYNNYKTAVLGSGVPGADERRVASVMGAIADRHVLAGRASATESLASCTLGHNMHMQMPHLPRRMWPLKVRVQCTLYERSRCPAREVLGGQQVLCLRFRASQCVGTGCLGPPARHCNRLDTALSQALICWQVGGSVPERVHVPQLPRAHPGAV